MVYVWLGIIILTVAIEFFTFDLISVWFAGGSLVAMILAACGLNLYFQIPAFIIVSLVLLLFFRSIVLKKLNVRKQNLNADAVIGKEFSLITAIGFNNPGTIKVNDVIWNVITENQQDEIKENTIVEVIGLKGNKYIVKEIKK